MLDAPDGAAALEQATGYDGRIDLLLTDVVMPGMSGSELARRLQALRPGIRVVFMSGYSPEAVATRGLLAPGSMFLPKPFSATQLIECIRKTLNETPSD